MDSQKIFFSYSRVDGESFALRLADDLRKSKVNIWLDQVDIAPGTAWTRAIEEALESSDCILFIATEASTTSSVALNEVVYALEEKKKVIPLIFQKCRMPLLLRPLQHIDFTSNYDAAFLRLQQTLGLSITDPSANDPVQKPPLHHPGSLPVKPQPHEERPPSVSSLPPANESNSKRPQKKNWIIGALVSAVIVLLLLLFVLKNKEAGKPGADHQTAGASLPENKRDSNTVTETGAANPSEKESAGKSDGEGLQTPATSTEKTPALRISSPEEGAVIDYPRTTTVRWNQIPGADDYALQVEFGNTADISTAADFHPFPLTTTKGISLTYQGIGMQVHRFKVQARQGTKILAETAWRYVTYSH